MRVLITGGNGQLGRACRSSAPAAAEVLSVDLPGFDLLQADQVRRTLAAFRPAVIFHLAAWTQVDQAEEHPEEALRVNRDGTRILATAAAGSGARMVYLSTDYVFSGTSSGGPWRENDEPAPCNAYGASKLAGEQEARRCLGSQAHVLRTSWLFGEHGKNFVDTMAGLLTEKKELRVVADQRGTPTPAADLARALWRLAASSAAPPILHYSGSPEVSWFQFAEAIREQMLQLGWSGLGALLPCSSSEYAAPAPRPAWSVLHYSSFWDSCGCPRPDWRSAIPRCLPVHPVPLQGR